MGKIRTGYIADGFGWIPLTRNQVARVDIVSLEKYGRYNWHAMWSKKTKSYYAVRNLPRVDGKSGGVALLHREILGLNPGDGVKSDHINHDTLDNTKDNLRAATNQQNMYNSRLSQSNTSGLKGACFDKRKKLWMSSIRVEGKSQFLGYYATAALAHEAYREAALKYHGEFARVA